MSKYNKLVKKFAKLVFPTRDDFVTDFNFDNGDINIKVEDRKQHNCIDFSIILYSEYKESSDDDEDEDEEDEDEDDEKVAGEIFINHLDKCESGSGTDLLSKVEYLSRQIGIRKLGLIDGSTIRTNCGTSFPLKTLYTLTTGQSWYNSKGYIDPYNQNKIKKHNKSIIKTKMAEFIMTLEEDEFLEESLDNIRQKTNLSIRLTVKDFFTSAKKILQESTDCTVISEFCYLLNKIKHDNVLQEGYELEKVLDYEPRCDECDEEGHELTREGLCTYCALERHYDERELEEIEEMGTLLQEEGKNVRSSSSSKSLSPIIQGFSKEGKERTTKKRKTEKLCKEGKEKINGRCVKKCKEGETRNEKRKCVKPKRTIKVKSKK
jgi:hypothetical protein